MWRGTYSFGEMKSFLAIVISLAVAAAAENSAAQRGGPLPTSTPDLLSLDLQDTDIRSVLRMLADMRRINLVVDDQVTGTISVRLKDVTWEQAFDAVLSLKGLRAVSFGGGVTVVPTHR